MRHNGYARAVAALQACPFCRELFDARDGLASCPICEVRLVPQHALPASAEERLEQEALWEATPVEYRRLSLWHFGQGRGPVVLCAMLGLALFACPWFELTRPETFTINGYQLARYYVGWLWAGAVAWFVLIPLVLSRRTLADLWGVRIVSTLFSSLSFFQVLLVVATSPNHSTRVPFEHRWLWGSWTTAAISLLGCIFALGLGGRRPARATESKPRSPSRDGTR